METNCSDVSTRLFSLTISVSCSVISSLGMTSCSLCSSSVPSGLRVFLRNSSMSSGQPRLSSGSHVFSALLITSSGRRYCVSLSYVGVTQQKQSSQDSPHVNSLSEAFPLQQVLYSPLKDSPANYFVHRKLLHNRSRLFSLPLFGSLLLSHSAVTNEKEINAGPGRLREHGTTERVRFCSRRRRRKRRRRRRTDITNKHFGPPAVMKSVT